MSRPKPPLSAWLIRHRKRLGLTPADIARQLDVAETTVRGWEAGRPIRSENIDALAVVFGEEAPERSRTSDDSLVIALTRQAAAIEALAVAIQQDRSQRAEWERGLLEGIRELLGQEEGPSSDPVRGPLATVPR